MNVKYEHIGAAFLIFLGLTGATFWLWMGINWLHPQRELEDLFPVHCAASDFFVPPNSDLYCQWPDHSGGFVKITYHPHNI